MAVSIVVIEGYDSALGICPRERRQRAQQVLVAAGVKIDG